MKELAERVKRSEICNWIGETERASRSELGFSSQALKGVSGYLQFLVADEGISSFIASKHIREAAKQAIDSHRNVYTPFRGMPEVRQAIVERMKKFNNVEVDPEKEVCVTNGTSQGVFTAMLTLVEPGDDVIILDPEYMGYFGSVRLAGGREIHVPYRYDEDDYQFKFNVENLKEAMTEKTKLIVFSNPCNPTGYVYSRNDLEAIAKLAREYDCYVFADELYENLVYDGRKHVSIASLSGMKERTITINGTSKTESMQIFRVGYITAPEKIMYYIAKLVGWSTLRVPYVSQKAFLAFITEKDDEFRNERMKHHKECRDYIVKRLNEIEDIKCNLPMGTSYVFPNHKEIEPSSAKFCLALVERGKIFLEPGFECGPNGEGHQRICFPQSIDKLEEGVRRIASVVKELRGK